MLFPEIVATVVLLCALYQPTGIGVVLGDALVMIAPQIPVYRQGHQGSGRRGMLTYVLQDQSLGDLAYGLGYSYYNY